MRNAARSLFMCLGAIPIACSQARAIVPDHTNPGHCVAVENVWERMFRRAGEQHQARAMKARIIWELREVVASGRIKEAHDEGVELTKQLAPDFKAQEALATACMEAEEANAGFQAARDRLMVETN